MTLSPSTPLIKGDGTIELAFTVDTTVSFAGASITWGLRQNSPTGTLTLTKSATITDADAKTFSVYLTKSDTDALDGVYYHDAVIVDASDNEITVRNTDGSAGRIEFIDRVTELA